MKDEYKDIDHKKKYYENNKKMISDKAKEYYRKNKANLKEYYNEYRCKDRLNKRIKPEHKLYVKNLLWLFDNNQYNTIDYYRVANVYMDYHKFQRNSEFIDDFDVETQVLIMRRKLRKMLNRG